jgi:UMF1 family MFS transporter
MTIRPRTDAPAPSRLAQAAWLSFEFANQPYFSLIKIFLFANYFANQLAPDNVTGQAAWGYTQAAAGLTIAICSPLLGSIADAGGRKRPWMAGCVTSGVVACAALWLAVPGSNLFLVAAGVVAASVSLEFIIMFGNALLPRVASGPGLSRLSGFGYGLSQFAGVLALITVLYAFQLPGRLSLEMLPTAPLLGLDRGQFEHERIVGPFAALWLLIFMLPVFIFITEPKAPDKRTLAQNVRTGVTRLRATLLNLRENRNVARYLLARMLYNDGLQAVFTFGGVIAGSVLGWGALELAVFGIAVTLSAGLGGLAGGLIDGRIGPRATIIIFLSVVVVTALALVTFQDDSVLYVFGFENVHNRTGPLTSRGELIFAVLACLFGFAAGPVSASSRALLARLAPPDRAGEFFGLYALSGKVTVYAAPLGVAIVTSLTASRQFGLAVILVFLVAGFVLFLPVREDRT